MIAATGLAFGLLVSAFWLGFRHGIDWDHIAAITDITSSQDERRRAVLFGTLYALGHAAVVFVLGMVAITLGGLLPAGLDEFMGKVVGVTLLILGVYVIVSLVRHGRDFRMRSRWMLLFAGVRRGTRWLRRRAEGSRANGNGAASNGAPSALHHGHHGRRGHHHHAGPGEDEHEMTYGRGTAFGVGMIHGVGAETPTQVLIFLSAGGSGSRVIGFFVLLAFIVGLLASNSIITVGSAFGFLQASRNFAIYATVAVLTAVFSLVIGTIFLLGKGSILPAFFGG